MGVTSTHEEYEEKLLIRELPYYPLEQYVNSKTPILHSCINEHSWKVSPSNILAGKGCPICAGNKKETTESYSLKLIRQGITQYVPCAPYINVDTKSLHKCRICEHKWAVRPNDILNGKGCPKCSRRGFSTAKSAVLYFVSFIHEEIKYYKIGITNHWVEKRIGSNQWKELQFKIEWELFFEKGSDALYYEQKLKKLYNRYHINTEALISGNSETFTVFIDKPKIDLDFEAKL